MGLGGFLGRLQDKWDDIEHLNSNNIAKHSNQPFSHFSTHSRSIQSEDNFTDEQVFLYECYLILTHLSIEREFRSQLAKDYFNQITLQAKSLFSPISAQSDIIQKHKAEVYILDAYFGFLYSKLLTTEYPRDMFRDIINDTVSLIKRWNIVKFNETLYSNQLFFELFSQRYSLSKHPFFVCPHCQGEIYDGIRNCPECYEIIHPNKQLISQVSTQTQRHNKELHTISQKMDSATLENEALKEELEALRRIIKEKDLAIKELQAYISGRRQSDKMHEKRILIIGAAHISKTDISELIKSFDIDESLVDIETDYKKIKNISARLQKSEMYRAIIVGPSPHKTKLSSESSFIETLKRKNIIVIEARNYQGELEITKESLSKSMEILILKLLSQRSA